MSARLEEKTQPRSGSGNGSAGTSRTGSTTASTTTSGTVTPNNEQETEKEEQREADIKIILLGDSAAGKSKLVERFLMNEYVPRNLSTHALTVFRHKGKYNGKEVIVDFWDTAGQERFASMHPSYYYRADACILVFDVTRKPTYQHLTDWYQELQQYRPGLPTLVVANKIDVNYEVVKKSFNFPQTREHCHKQVYFCSAADGTNVVKLFHEAIAAALKYKESPVDDFNEEVLRTIDYFDSKSELKKVESANKTTAK